MALAWLLAQKVVVPVPGTKRRKNLEENVAAIAITLTNDDIRRIDETALKGATVEHLNEYLTALDTAQSP